jgi:hypothetical protein
MRKTLTWSTLWVLVVDPVIKHFSMLVCPGAGEERWGWVRFKHIIERELVVVIPGPQHIVLLQISE